MREVAPDEELSAYLDGELTDAESLALQKRLDSDSALRDELASLEEAVLFMRTHGPAQAPPDLLPSVLEAVANEPMPAAAGWWTWLRKPFGIPLEGFAVAAAAVAVLLVALPDPPSEVADRAVPAAPMSDDTKRAPASSLADKEPEPARQQETRDAVAAVELEAAEPVLERPKVAEKAAPKSRPSPIEKSAGGTSAAAEAGASAGSKGAADEEPAYYSVPFSFSVRSTDDDALLLLQKLALRYGGRVLDAQQRPASATRLQPGVTDFFVEIPGRSMASFEDDLRGLGAVMRYDSEQGLYPAEGVMVRVSLQIEEPPVQKKSARPAQEAAQEPAVDEAGDYEK